MPDLKTHPGETASWFGTIAATGLFLVIGIVLILGEIPHEWRLDQSALGYLFLTFLLLPAIGYAVGWIYSFPRWSYPYVSLMLLFSLFMMRAATPGMRIFGYTFESNEPWGWRAWIPFLSATLVALLVTRSLRPLGRFFTNIWQDWTLLVFAMYGFMPVLIFISFDEMDRLYSLYFMVLLTLSMCATALVYMRSRSLSRRALTLAIGTLLTVGITSVATTAYWAEGGLSQISVLASFGLPLIIVVMMFSPALIGLLQWIIRMVSPSKAT